MTALTLPTKHRSLWHFVPGLALTAALTGAALWAGSFPAIAGAGFSALTLAILFGMVVGNTVYPKIWQPCDGGGDLRQAASAAPGDHPLRLSPDARPDCRRRRERYFD